MGVPSLFLAFALIVIRTPFFLLPIISIDLGAGKAVFVALTHISPVADINDFWFAFGDPVSAAHQKQDRKNFSHFGTLINGEIVW